MFNKLYFIGNGFDLHHGLKTSYLQGHGDRYIGSWKYLVGELERLHGSATSRLLLGNREWYSAC